MMSVCSRIHTFAMRSLHSIGTCPNLKRNYTPRIMSRAPSNLCCLTFSAGSSGNRYSRISVSQSASSSSSCSLQIFQRMYSRSVHSKKKGNYQLVVNKSSSSSSGTQEARFDYLFGRQNGSVIRVSSPRQGVLSSFKCNAGPFSWSYARASAGLMFGLLVCSSSSDYSYADSSRSRNDKHDCEEKSGKKSHGKIVHTDYSVIGIPGDGRCLFRSVAHGASIRLGKPAPSESLQRELADELRDRVADEFIKRREETEWFIEGDFDSYVAKMRKPHVWGGEPELLMLSHVLMMPITVYMRDESLGGLISIAEYGQEYDKDNPIRVLYHGFGHYDALLIPGKKPTKSRL